MKNPIMKFLALLLFSSLLSAPSQAQEQKPPQKLPFSVYSDQVDHFAPSGHMGDNSDITIVSTDKNAPGKGAASMKVKYSAKAAQGNKWAGVFWQEPANNWGKIKGAGFNLTGAKKIKFLARGEKGGEVVEFKAGGITGDFPDSFKVEGAPTTLTKDWKEYEVDLTGQDLSNVIGGFCFTFSKDKNPEGCVFYLDDIRYVAE